MKLAILTFTEGQNIGQRLQNYALQEVLKNRGHIVYTLKQSQPILKRMLKRVKNYIEKSQNRTQLESKRIFNEFNNNYINFYKRSISFYSTYMIIHGWRFPYCGNQKKIEKQFDGFVVGSDQVWNPLSPDVSDNFFVTFADSQKRFNYAPSLAVEEIPSSQKTIYKKRLDGFNYITVREDRGAELIKELTGKEAKVVLDPTLLLRRIEWDKLKKKYTFKPKKKYIFALFLGTEPQNEIRQISEMLGYAVYSVYGMVQISPNEFLDIVDNSELILTDSYHVTIFSIIYHVPFINFDRKGGVPMSSRFDTLYRMTGIRGRTWEDLKDKNDLWTYMEFTEIDKNINRERENSIDILELQGI